MIGRPTCPNTGSHSAYAASVGHALQDEDARDEELERCDQRFYARDENIEESQFEFIKKHQGAIDVRGWPVVLPVR